MALLLAFILDVIAVILDVLGGLTWLVLATLFFKPLNCAARFLEDLAEDLKS
jgi:hypothetical protein